MPASSHAAAKYRRAIMPASSSLHYLLSSEWASWHSK